MCGKNFYEVQGTRSQKRTQQFTSHSTDSFERPEKRRHRQSIVLTIRNSWKVAITRRYSRTSQKDSTRLVVTHFVRPPFILRRESKESKRREDSSFQRIAPHLVTTVGTMNIYRVDSALLQDACRRVSGSRVRIRMVFSLRPARSRTMPSIVGRISRASIFYATERYRTGSGGKRSE